MLHKLLAFDIGNTHIKTAVFADGKILLQWRLATDPKRTSDEYISILKSLFKEADINEKEITSSIISSVVPTMIEPFLVVSERLCGKKALVLSPEIYDMLPVKVPQSAIYQIGTDLLCDAIEGFSVAKGACIVVDFGTALSFSAVDKQGNIQGIAIAPGLQTAVKSLFTNTAQLPAVPLELPKNSLGTNTTESIQAGIVLGYKGLVESLILRMKKDLSQKTSCNESEITVIATGGLSSILEPSIAMFDKFEKNLTLNGLYRVACVVEKQI